jgi:hypothetical protein
MEIVQMNRFVMTDILRMAGRVAVVTVIAVIIIALLGLINQWDSSTPYSNAFFIAGAIMIAGGVGTKMRAGEDWTSTQEIHPESLSGMTGEQQSRLVLNPSNSTRLAIMGMGSGTLLVLMSLLVLRLF